MGKISEALEKNIKEKAVVSEKLYDLEPAAVPSLEKKDSLKKNGKLHLGQGFDPKLIVWSAPDSINAENFKMLRAQILFSQNRRPRSLLITSIFPGEGKTFVSSNLAVSIALGIDEHVLLVDCDFRRPSIHKMFGYSNIEGLHEFLTDKRPLNDLIIRTNINKLSVITAGKTSSNPSELLSSSVMEAFLKEVKDRYQDRFIIIDSTPLHATSEAAVLARNVDGIILVIRNQRAPREAIKKAISFLGKEKILGIVFNGYHRANDNYRKYYKKYYK